MNNLNPVNIEFNLIYAIDNVKLSSRPLLIPEQAGDIYQTPSTKFHWVQLVKLDLNEDSTWPDIFVQFIKLITEIESHGGRIGTIGVKSSLVEKLKESSSYTIGHTKGSSHEYFRGIPLIVIGAAFWSEEFVLVTTDYPNPIKLT